MYQLNSITAGMIAAVQGWAGDAGLTVVFGDMAAFDHDRRVLYLHEPFQAQDSSASAQDFIRQMHDIWLAEGLHETSHALWSDPAWHPARCAPGDELALMMYRALEDIRIDTANQVLRPGAKAMYERGFMQLRQRGYWTPVPDDAEPMRVFRAWLLYAGRARICRQTVTFGDLHQGVEALFRQRFGDIFADKAWAILEDIRSASSTKDVFAIIQRLKALLQNDDQEQQPEDQQQGDDDSSEDDDDDQAQQQPQGEAGKDDQASDGSDDSQSSQEGQSPTEGEQSPEAQEPSTCNDGSPTGETQQDGSSSAGAAQSQCSPDSAQAQALRELKDAADAEHQPVFPEDQDIDSILGREIDKARREASFAGVSCVQVPTFRTAKPSPCGFAGFPDTQVTAMRVKNLLERPMRQQTSHDRVGARLDQTILWRSRVGDRDLFLHHSVTSLPDAAWDIVTDVSDSMRTGDRIGKAARAGMQLAMIGHAIKGVSVGALAFPLGVAGGVSELCPIGRDPRQYAGDWLTLQADGGTPMDQPIRHSMVRLLSRKEQRRIMLIVTDGQPDPSCRSDVVTLIEQAKRLGIEIIGVGIGVDARYVTDLFPQSVVVDDAHQLAGALIKVLAQHSNRLAA